MHRWQGNDRNRAMLCDGETLNDFLELEWKFCRG
jgi:hypothetical protein